MTGSRPDTSQSNNWCQPLFHQVSPAFPPPPPPPPPALPTHLLSPLYPPQPPCSVSPLWSYLTKKSVCVSLVPGSPPTHTCSSVALKNKGMGKGPVIRFKALCHPPCRLFCLSGCFDRLFTFFGGKNIVATDILHSISDELKGRIWLGLLLLSRAYTLWILWN